MRIPSECVPCPIVATEATQRIGASLIMRGSFPELRNAAASAKVPCWPNPSGLTVLLTKNLRRFFGRYLAGIAILGPAVALAFDAQANWLLRSWGYGDNFISYFPQFRALYTFLAMTGIASRVDIADFHILDFFLWWTIFISLVLFVARVIYLRQYDDFYQKRSVAIARLSHWMRALLYVGVILLPIELYVFTQPIMIYSETLRSLNRDDPKVYLWVVSINYFVVGCLYVELVLWGLWKIFCQHRPGVVLWRQNAQSTGAAVMGEAYSGPSQLEAGSDRVGIG